MRLHRNAKTTPRSRAELIDRVRRQGWTIARAAEGASVSERTVYKWLARERTEGTGGLEDRRSTPRRVRRRLSPYWVGRVLDARRKRRTAAQIAQRFALPRATVSRVLARNGLSRLRALDPVEPVVRYERERPGELVHFDVKKLGRIDGVGHRIHGDFRRRSRGVGWEFVHVAVDDKTRLAYVEALSDERGVTARAFLERVIRWFARRGIKIERVLSDNGSCYRSRHFLKACKLAGIQAKKTRAYRPQTNGKAERFIQTLIRGWAYARPYRSSLRRVAALPEWLRYYNTERPHRALGNLAPLTCLRRCP
jgi:transposase InsO family protein